MNKSHFLSILLIAAIVVAGISIRPRAVFALSAWDVSPLTCVQNEDCLTTLQTNFGGGVTHWALTLTDLPYNSPGIATSTCAAAPSINTDFFVTITPTIAPGNYHTVYAGWNTGSCSGAPYIRAIDDTRDYTVTAPPAASAPPAGFIQRAYLMD